MNIWNEIRKTNNFPEVPPPPWQERHATAFRRPVGNEAPITRMLEALADYADNHKQQFDRDLADDGFLGPVWLEMCRSFLQLLNGDLGRLDGGTLDKSVREMCRMAGFSEEEADTL